MKEPTDLELFENKNLFLSVKADKERRLEQLLNKRKEHILNLKENWDDDGAEMFTIATFQRVSGLLKRFYQDLWNNMVDAPFPLISPVPDGSIDINWETDKFELLINIPSMENNLVNIYGENPGHPEDEIEVRINFDMVAQYIIPWLNKVIS